MQGFDALHAIVNTDKCDRILSIDAVNTIVM